MKKNLIFLIMIFFLPLSIKTANSENLKKDEIISLIEEWQKALKNRLKYKFEPTNFDPFKPIKITLKPAPITENITVYLKEYNLNELRLVGIIKTKKSYIAIIEDPQGRGVFLKKGDYLGKNGSIITKITDCAVYISQRYVNEKGEIIISTKPIILSLKGEEKECLEKL